MEFQSLAQDRINRVRLPGFQVKPNCQDALNPDSGRPFFSR